MTRVTLEISLANDDSDVSATDAPPNDATISPGHRREELARMIVKEKNEDDAGKTQDDTTPDHEPSPTTPYDENKRLLLSREIRA